MSAGKPPRCAKIFSLPFVIIFALAAAASFAIVSPPGEGPDESGHLAYAMWIASTGSRPGPAESYEAHQPPLDYLFLASASALISERPPALVFEPNPHFQPGSVPSKYLPLDQKSRGSAAHVRSLRVVHLAWLLVTLAAVQGLVGLLSPAYSLASFAAGMWILNPQLLFISGMINNDDAVIALCTVTFLLLAVILRRLSAGDPDSPALLLAAGLSAGLAFTAKSSAIVLAPGILYVAAAAVKGGRFRSAAALVCAALLSTAALGYAAGLNPAAAPPIVRSSGFLEQAGHMLHPWWIVRLWVSFWGNFGWLSVKLPPPVYAIFLFPTCIALTGGIAALRKHPPRAAGTVPDYVPRIVTLSLVCLVTNLLSVLGYMCFFDWQPQGRYLFPTLSAQIVLAAYGLDILMSPETGPADRLPRGITAYHWLVQQAAVVFAVVWVALRLR